MDYNQKEDYYQVGNYCQYGDHCWDKRMETALSQDRDPGHDGDEREDDKKTANPLTI